MITGAILAFLATLLNGLYAVLPPWTIALGTGSADGSTGVSSDHNVLFYMLGYIMEFDKLLPLHDGYAIQLGISLQINTAIYAYRVVLLILNLVRGSGAK